MPGGGWSALGSAILGGQQAWRQGALDAEKKREQDSLLKSQMLQQQAMQQQLDEAPMRRAMALSEKQKMDDFNTMSAATIKRLPITQAEQDMTLQEKVFGKEGKWSQPAFGDAAGRAGMPLQTKPVPTFLDSTKFGTAGVKDDSKAQFNIDQGTDATTGYVLPPDILEAQKQRHQQQVATDKINAGALGKDYQDAFTYGEATGGKAPPARLIPPDPKVTTFRNWNQGVIVDDKGNVQRVDIGGPSGPARSGGDGSGAGGSALDEGGLDLAATAYRLTRALPARDKTQNGAIINRAAAQGKSLGQSPVQMMQRQAAYKADSGSLVRMTQMASAAEAFEQKALQQADLVGTLSDKVSRTDVPVVNSWLLAGKAAVGDTPTHLLGNALITFSAEYAKIMEGSTGSVAASTEGARASAAKLITSALSKGTLAATLDQMRREMRMSIDGYGIVIDHINGRLENRKSNNVPGATPGVVDPPVAPPVDTSFISSIKVKTP